MVRMRLVRWGAAAGIVAAGVVAAVLAGDESTAPVEITGIDALKVASESTSTYHREAFNHWVDSDNDGCDTRAEVLRDESLVDVDEAKDCRVISGEWESFYDGDTITDASNVDIDHVVPLAEAWRSGAWDWDGPKREAYANDLQHDETLVAVSASSNRSKGDKDPASWLPEHDQCGYIQDWVDVKRQWELSVNSAELSALKRVADSCLLVDVDAHADVAIAVDVLAGPVMTGTFIDVAEGWGEVVVARFRGSPGMASLP